MPTPAPSEPTADPQQSAAHGLLALTANVVAWRIVAVASTAAASVVTARQLGPAGRGVMVLVLTVSSVGVALGSGGVHFSGRVALVSRTDRVSPESYAGLALALALALGLGGTALGAVALPYAHVATDSALPTALGLVAASLLLQFLLVEELQAFGFMTRAAMVDAWSGVTQLGLVGTVAVGGARTAVPFLLAVALSNGLGAVAAVTVLRRSGIRVRPSCEFDDWRLLLRQGRPGVMVTLAELLTFRLDRYLVGVLLLPEAVGIYATAATAPEMLRLPLIAIAQPVFYRLAAGSASLDDFRRTRRMVLLITAAMVVATLAVAPAAVKVVFGEAYAGAVTPLRILLLSEFGVALFYLDGSALAGLNRTRESAWAALLGLLVTTVGDLLLIRWYGLAGAAWASVVGYSVMGIATHLCVRRSVP